LAKASGPFEGLSYETIGAQGTNISAGAVQP
jgi:hypothetical protein